MSEYKINMDRSDPTPEEIARNKDFSKVLNQYSTLTQPVYTKTWFLSTATLVVAAGLLIVANLFMDKKDQEKDVEQSYVYQPSQVDLITQEPFVNPPLDGTDIPYETYIVDAAEKSKLKYHTGTKIKVPKNAFIDEKGNDIDGEVELRYREFHDVADFFVSGIPMDYDSAGVKYHFESAGMMEMLAYKNGKPIFLKPEKEIKIEMVSNYEGSHYNLYELDTANREWSYRGKDQVTPVVSHEARPEEIEPGISSALDDEYYYDEGRPTAIVPEQELPVKKLARKVKIATEEVKKVKKTKPVEPKQVSKTRYNFDIAVNPDEFPEISVYEGTLFEIGDENRNFSSKMYDIKWEDIILKEKDPGINYNLTLVKGQTKYTWVVYPVFEGKDLAKAKEIFKEKFDKYTEKLDIRRAEEKKAKEDYAAKLAEYERKRAEQLAKWEEQRRQYTEAQKTRIERLETYRKTVRAFNITRFGTWNCDSPIPRPRGKSVMASFTDAEGNPLVFDIVYLVQKDRNALFTYYAQAFNNLKFNPNQENVLWAITSDNRVAIFQADRFKDMIIRNGKYTFEMNVLKDEPGSVAEVREAISI